MARDTYSSSAHGAYLAAAELAGRGFIVTVTARNAPAADLLVSDRKCRRAYSVQVKTQKGNPNYWLVGKAAGSIASPSHIYVLINLCGGVPEFYVVPSADVKRRTTSNSGSWHNFPRDDQYRDNWRLFGKPN